MIACMSEEMLLLLEPSGLDIRFLPQMARKRYLGGEIVEGVLAAVELVLALPLTVGMESVSEGADNCSLVKNLT